MHDPHDTPLDDQITARLLRAVDGDAAPVDLVRLAAIETVAAAAFDDAADQQPPSKRAATDSRISQRRKSMFPLALRGAATVAAMIAGLALWFSGDLARKAVAEPTFADVLAKLVDAQSLHLRVTRDDGTGQPREAEVFLATPGLVRWEDSPTQYRVAAGSRLWRVDEAKKTVTPEDSPWFLGPQKQVDLLGLLELSITDAAALTAAPAAHGAEYAGRPCIVFRAVVPSRAGPVAIAAFADPQSNELLGITARSPGDDAAGPPLAELQLIAFNPPIDEAKFAVAKSLADDGALGKVTDAQGIVTLRPILASRWTPLCRDMPLRIGDWLRTDLRGANAALATLASGVELTLGPGTLVEFVSPTSARLHQGEVQVMLPPPGEKKKPPAFELLAPKDGSRAFTVAGKTLVRVVADPAQPGATKLVDIPQTPRWLAGFEGATTDESLGSLIVQVDGRNEPLSVGYHKVSVEIRDQIARTTIEESFVNHTDSRLEGVFHFPLPADASISGFGMWIGNDLVEADVVEKQRAREIYETILRERRDPGLLEWTAGNLFKARVFPIEPHSEKRVKIVYTQVLPRRGNTYRYTYALRSDLLRTKPLRELSLSVLVNSAVPLEKIECTTHPVRTQQGAHSGKVEFTAQEFTPERDFEVVCTVDGRQSDVVMIPHRRGDDGYFLLQIAPPSDEGMLKRETLPNGQALNVVLLCDTSFSMDDAKRREQQEFVATMLAALGDDDRFMLAAMDVGPAWSAEKPQAPTEENIAAALDFLEHRTSLGWTDLDRGFKDVLEKTPAESHVIYIGDGIQTAGDRDPPSVVRRLRRIVGDAAEAPHGRSFHAVTVGNTFDRTVMEGIASLGGGSSRAIAGERTPGLVAAELLDEIARPGLTDLKVDFRGLRVAAVYPGALPNIAAGTQQILVGRYLPEGVDQHGEVVVTGRRGGEDVRYVAKVALEDAEEGNSFIPRLWARSHLDFLLSQGTNQSVQDDVIALSEEFHIITPYTSLLVLETDADRERFGVKRRYEMRDGERFFAQGKANANFELLQQQMTRAAEWRTGLRRSVLRQFAGLGRSAEDFRQVMNDAWRSRVIHGSSSTISVSGGLGGPVGGLGGPVIETLEHDFDDSGISFAYEMSDVSPSPSSQPTSLSEVDATKNETLSLGLEIPQEGELYKSISGRAEDEADFRSNRLESLSGKKFSDEKRKSSEAPFARRGEGKELGDDYGWFDGDGAGKKSRRGRGQVGGMGGRGYIDYVAWVHTLFPALPPPPEKPAPSPADLETWSPDAIALAKSLDYREPLAQLTGGIETERDSESFNARWDRRTGQSNVLTLYSPTAWLSRPVGPAAEPVVHFALAKRRGVYSLPLLLGQEREATPQDFAPDMLGLADWSLGSLMASHRAYTATVEPAGDNRAKLVLTFKPANGSVTERHLLIDLAKHVVVRSESFSDGKRTTSTEFSDFVEAAGLWWAAKAITRDGEGKQTAVVTLRVRAFDAAAFADRIQMELAARPRVAFMQVPGVPLKEARQRVADGSADFDDRLTMILHFASLQQWDDLLIQLAALEKQADDKPGVRWLRPVIFATIRRNEEARQFFLAEAKALAARAVGDAAVQPGDRYLADFILNLTQQVSSSAEQLVILDLLRPVYDREPEWSDARVSYDQRLANNLDSLSRAAESLAARKRIADATPWDVYAQINYARQLLAAGQPAAAYAWLDAAMADDKPWEPYQLDAIDQAYADMYRSEVRWADLLKLTTAWVAKAHPSSNAYAQHLSALVFNDRLDDANALVLDSLRESRAEGAWEPAARARWEAAVSFAQGNPYGLSFQRMDEQWYEPLAETVTFLLKHPERFDAISRVYDYRLQQSDAGDRLRGQFLHLLRTELANLRHEQLQWLVSHTLSGRMQLVKPLDGRKQMDATEVPLAVWKDIAAALRKRWQHAVDTEPTYEKHAIGEILRSVYAARFGESELVPFLRERLAVSPAGFKLSDIAALYEALLTQPWTEEGETEAFATWRILSDAVEPVDRLPSLVPALHRLNDAMLANRLAAAERTLSDAGDVNQLTRTELAEKKTAMARAARTGLADRLAAEGRKETGELADWLRMEQAWLDIPLGRRLPEIREQCWRLLGDSPPNAITEMDEDDQGIVTPDQQRMVMRALLEKRAFFVVMNLAARAQATQADIDRLITYLDSGIARPNDAATPWRRAKFDLLIALDRPDDLDRELRAWIRADVTTAPWRQALAYLVAERGNLDEAISLFEVAEKDQLLTAADYSALAAWYTVVGKKNKADHASMQAIQHVPEHLLQQIIQNTTSRWQRNDIPLPSELDETTLRVFETLFQKSASPENYLWELRELYAACRDFRLLQMIPIAILGRSPQQIYPFLESLKGQVLSEMRNEATADEIMARIQVLREAKRTPVDLRGLDLLEALIARQSAEVQNQRGPHVDACLAALKRAFTREMGDSEPPLMAAFLAHLGKLPDAKLEREQLHQLRELLKRSAPATRERLEIASHLATVEFWNYDRRDEALRVFEPEMRAYEQAHGGQWPHEDNDLLEQYLRMLAAMKRFAASEEILEKYLAVPQHEQQRQWLDDQLLAVYVQALEHQGEVSLGSGETLFENLVRVLGDRLEHARDENVRYSLVARLVSACRIAHQQKMADVANVVRTVAFETVPNVLERQSSQYRNTVTTPLELVAEVLGPLEAVRYMLDRMEHYPQRFEYAWDNSWNAFGGELARRWHEARAANDGAKNLEPRVLAVVLTELRRELRTGENRNDNMFRRHHSYFWAERQSDFAATAEEVYREHRTSGRRVAFIAGYLWSGLELRGRAIEMLLVAQGDGLLDDGMQETLISYLFHEQRYAEAIPIAELLVRAQPDAIARRVRLMQAYFHCQRQQQLLELLAKTDAHFHAGGRWTASNVAALGDACLECHLFEPAIGYLGEAVSMWQRATDGRTRDHQALSHSYQQLARAYSAIGNTQKAVDAASGAIVCWPEAHERRAYALNALNEVLRNAKDLSEFIQHLDDDAARTGQDSAVLRKGIGTLLKQRGEWAGAITQLKLARDLQPADKETRLALIECYDRSEQPAAATAELLALVTYSRHDLPLFEQLANRLESDQAQAERAATSIIEAGPTEAENHAALAELRQRQDRWDKAIPHWKEVAELRRLEPTGLLKLAEAQLHEKQFPAARETLQKLRRAEWPSRFGSIDDQVRHLEGQMPTP